MADPNAGQQTGVGMVRNQTAAQLTAQNYTFPKQVFVVESDTGKIKLGDGATAWTSLGYTNSGSYVNSQIAAYEFTMADAGNIVLHPTADNNARTFTIPANSAVPFPIGTEIKIINQINTVTIAITTDTLELNPAGTTGSRSLATDNTCIITKIAATTWVISGTSGLT